MSKKLFALHLPEGHRLSAATGSAARGLDRVLLAPHPDAANVTDAVLVASDARMLAVLPVTVSGPGSKPLASPVPAQLLPARPLDTAEEGSATSLLVRQTRFPDVRTVLPAAAQVAGYTELSVDTDVLCRLVDAISQSTRLTLLIPPPQEGRVAAAVVAIGFMEDEGGDRVGPAGVGLLMPLGSDDPAAAAKWRNEALAHYGALVARVPAGGLDAGVNVGAFWNGQGGPDAVEEAVKEAVANVE
jgi:hypothetical protein